MATQQDSILGLFTTPQQYQLARDQQLATNQLELSKLSPEQQAVYNIGQGFRGAVDVGARALGANDPQLQLLSLRNQLAQGKDLTSFEGWSKYTQDLQKAGDLQGAAAAAQRATDLRSKFEEKQAARDLQLQISREKNQTAEQIASERNAIMAQIAQLNASFKGANSDVQRQLIEQRIEDLKGKAAEKEATLQTQAQGRVAAFDSALDTLDVIAKHPGKKDVVGAVTGGIVSLIPGTNAAGFASQLETFKAQTFIPQVAALKGMGALSDAEGKKLTAAVGALDPKMKQKEFDSQLTKIKGDLEAAKQRALSMPGMPKQPSTPAVGTVTNPIVLK